MPTDSTPGPPRDLRQAGTVKQRNSPRVGGHSDGINGN